MRVNNTFRRVLAIRIFKYSRSNATVVSPIQPTAGFVFSHPVHLLAFGLGTGLSPLLPGTIGTLLAVPLYLIMQYLPLWGYLSITAILLCCGIWICQYTTRALGVHDYEGIVWDELVGYLVTMCMAPHGWAWVVAGFVVFRFFDILKPWPVSWVDSHIMGGAGIMMDDVIAALYGFLVVQIAALWLT
jgi:phosphatidylglycerophosphatase A